MQHLGLLLTLLSALFLSLAEARDKQAFCATCHVVVEEMEYTISKVDPKKLLQVNSFRVDPNGNQKSSNIPFARSETHLTELMESVCERMTDYAKSTSKETGKLSYVRTKTREGEEGLKLENVSLSGQSSEKLKFMCENLIEDHEEELTDFLKTPQDNAVEAFCGAHSGICEQDDNGGEEGENHDEL